MGEGYGLHFFLTCDMANGVALIFLKHVTMLFQCVLIYQSDGWLRVN